MNEKSVQHRRRHLLLLTFLLAFLNRMATGRDATRNTFECTGCDTEGRSYGSIREMWADELRLRPTETSCVTENAEQDNGDGDNDSKELVWYKKSETYWSSQEPTVRGMLGGLEIVHEADIKSSHGFLDMLAKIDGLSIDRGYALDVGAGIGRITRELLLPRFDVVDMLEQNEAYLAESVHYLSSSPVDSSKTGVVHRRIPCGMQQFCPEESVTGQSYRTRYNIIWIQWCIIYLTDDDLVRFIHVCFQCLVAGGVVCVKDNIAPLGPNGFVLDRNDSSIMRSDRYMKNLFARAGARIVGEQLQPHFPQNMYPVKTWALVCASADATSGRPATRSCRPPPTPTFAAC